MSASPLEHMLRDALRASRSVLVTALILCLVGCGAAAAGDPGFAPRPLSPDVLPSLSMNSGASADVAGLHVQSSGILCQNWIVLSGSRMTFDAGSLQQMRSYIKKATSYYVDEQSPAAVLPPNPDGSVTPEGQPPDTLRVVMGSVGDDYSGNPHYSQYIDDSHAYGCVDLLQWTNISEKSVQVSQVGVTYAAASQPNNVRYPLIDMCTMVACGSCGGCGASVACVLYASIALRSGPAGTEIDAPLEMEPGGGSQCTASAPLAPGEVGGTALEFASLPASQLYRLSLSLTVDGTRVALPDTFGANVAFAAASQFDCYGLLGGALYPEPVKRSCA